MPKKPSEKKPKARPKKPSHGIGFRLFLLVLCLAVIGAIGGIAWAFLPAGPSTERVKVEIPNKATARDIAEKLKQKGVIRSETAFLVMARILDEAGSMQAGDYRVAPNMSLVQIIHLLSRGEGLAKWVTIPEGYTLKQIAETLDDSGLVDARRFERIARAGGKSFRDQVSFEPPQNLEGYLFPDTYKMPLKSTERKIIVEMLKTFDKKVAQPLKEDFARAKAQGRSMREIVIIASMVEREALKKDEQSKIAGVIMNRLENGMRLQIDATVQYALAAPKRRLLYRDLEVASPYNTYKIDGLPPGPISSPGLQAIKAALKPEDTKALYYVARPDGSHIFTRTLKEHNEARQKVRRMSSESS
ncbi:MAG: endolytic transglycosylase MltG [Armatimonadetes bacterium]|nr:endolytic transglycosylase MltG [Armatimonadota bacterium]